MLKPVRDNIVIKVLDQDPKTKGGILLPGEALEKPYKGVVIACNKQFSMPDGSIKKSEVEVGDIVMFGKTHGTEVAHQDSKYLVISEEFILCKVAQHEASIEAAQSA